MMSGNSTNQEIKHQRCFDNILFTFIYKQMFGKNMTKFQSERISKYVFLLQSVAGNSRLKFRDVLLALAYLSLSTTISYLP